LSGSWDGCSDSGRPELEVKLVAAITGFDVHLKQNKNRFI
jgi:hypothetical protein